MIIYFTDRKMNVLGQASTSLPQGLTVVADKKTEDIETGIAIFECEIPYDAKTLEEVKKCCEVGNYILRKHENENEFYTIIESEKDTKNQSIYIYCEDAGLDLLNEVVGPYTADKAYSIDYYINKFAYDSGFVIGINEASDLSRKLSWDGEATAAQRIRSVATQFDNCEISYSFDIDNLIITKKIINIYKKKGKDIGVQLRLNKEIDRIITKTSIANLATGLEVTGGIPDNAENPITLNGYKYDDGDFYVSGNRLLSRKALQIWSRYLWAKEPSQVSGEVGHIVQQYSYDTTSQSELFNRALSELKKIREIEVNYDVDISKLPDNVKIGDRVNIIDDAGSLYLSTRLLKLEASIADKNKKSILGEHLIKGSGIAQKVIDLANKFSQNAQSAQRALEIANQAKTTADNAKTQADNALQQSESVQDIAEQAKQAADKATQSAQEVTNKANEMQTAVDGILESVESLETTISDAKTAADNAYKAANTAKQDAETAKQQASEAVTNANEAKQQASEAKTSSDSAILKADDAVKTAGTAKSTAESASSTAAAAKADAQQAQKDVDALSDSLETLSRTMTADYARKTDLTETASNLQSQITQNAGKIETAVKQITTIDETANNAKDLADAASATAIAAQNKANAATADATSAQTAATEAKKAAEAAQTNADTAKKAAENAKSVADKAEKDLASANADLATVKGRVDATEEDIAAAEAKVTAAQAAADKAKQDAETASSVASDAQTKANNAVTNATNAQKAANDAVSKAELAQAAADKAKGDASAAITKANEAATTAKNAQSVADTAKANAATAQTKANEAASAASAAQSAANAADAKAAKATTDLEAAKKNLEKVSSDLGATQEEVEAAQAAVVVAQQAADKAKADAVAAQNTANTAKTNADKAQTDATNAKKAADTAQTAADNAKKAADKAQADVNALTTRVTNAETKITQNANAIKLAATKEEVTQTLGGYYTKAQTDAAITTSANSIKSTVSSEITTKINDIQIGARNYILKSDFVVENMNNSQMFEIAPDFLENARGKYICISCDYEVANVTNNTQNRLGCEFQVTLNDGSKKVFGVWKTITTGETSKGRIQAVHKFDGNVTEITNPLYAYVYFIKGDKRILKNFKLEIGTKMTDFTLAPEDMATADELASTEENLNNVQDEFNEKISVAQSDIEQLANSISMLVVDENGSSLMEQTSDGWVFKMGKTINNIENAISGLEQVQKDLNEQGKTIGSLGGVIDDLKNLGSYMRINIDGEHPVLELGNTSEFKLQITNDGIFMLSGTNVNANMDHEQLNIKVVNVESELRQGGFVQVIHNGNLGDIWKGE